MNYRKTLAVSLAALAAAGLIAGCGGENRLLPRLQAPLPKQRPSKSASPPFRMNRSSMQ